jgi:hypothetical protein
MITASFKHPKFRKLIYGTYLTEKDVPREILHNNKVYILYGIHQDTTKKE